MLHQRRQQQQVNVSDAPGTRQQGAGLLQVVVAAEEGQVVARMDVELLRQFGTARLDVWEGDARKLQFAGNACVLDVYLYPSERGKEPEATYVDARRPSDGQDVDRAACIAALRKGKG